MAVKKASGFWKNRRVLVTGGAGFIGYALATTLVRLGARVVILDIQPALPTFTLDSPDPRRKITYKRGSVTNKKLVAEILSTHKTQTVFHLAAEAIVGRANAQPIRTLRSNVEGTWTLLEEIRKNGNVEETVVASSDKAYGSHERLPYKEEAALKGINPYDCSKSCTDLIAQMYAHSFAMPIVVLRCGNVYGPGDMNWSRLIPDALQCALKGKSFAIRSDGTFKRDYVYIDDVVDAYALMAEEARPRRLGGEAFNIGHNKPLSVLQVLKKIKQVQPALRYKILNTATHEIKHQYLDASKVRSVFKWQPKVSIDTGVRKTLDWYREYIENKN